MSQFPSARRSPRALLILALAAAVGLVPMAAPAQAATPKEKKLGRLVNAYRVDHGRSKLKRTDKLTRLARKHSRAMADAGYIFHSTTKQLTSYLNKAKCDASLGENVGYNPGTVADIHQGFIDSKPHRQGMLGANWEKMGVGIVQDDSGMMFATELFCF